MIAGTPEIEGPSAPGAVAPRPIDVVRSLVLGAIAAAVGLGIAVTLTRLIGTAHPSGLAGAGFPAFDSVAIDGQSFYLGQPTLLFQDPADGYTALGYTPLLPVVTGLLDHLHLWRGWPSILSALSSIGLLCVVSAHAFRGPARGTGGRWPRLLAVVEALGFAALMWAAIATAVGPAYFYSDRPDLETWFGAIAGLAFLPRASRGDRKALVFAILLLSVGFLSKQTTISAPITGGIWLVATALVGATTWRTVLLYGGGLLGLNGAVVAIENVITSGWAWQFQFATPASQGCCALSKDFETYVQLFFKELAAVAFWLFALLAVLAICAIVTARVTGARVDVRRPLVALRSDDLGVRAAVLFGVYVLVALGGAMIARKIYGASQNQSLGVMWSLAVLGALTYRWIGRRSLGAATVTAAALVVVTVLGSLLGNGTLFGFPRPRLDVAAIGRWGEVPAGLRAFAADRVVYHPIYSDLSVAGPGEISPNWISIASRMAGGNEPEFVKRGILERRYDGVFPFTEGLVVDPILSAGDAREQLYLWKINRAMEEKYRAVPGLAEGGRERIEGPDPAPWIDRCFGPYPIDGVVWRGHVGGGFWCPEGSSLTLRETPELVDNPSPRFSTVRTEDQVGAVAGDLAITLPRGRFVLSLDTDLDSNAGTVWAIGGERRGDGIEVGARASSIDVGSTEPGPPVGTPVRVKGDRATVRLVPGDVDAPQVRAGSAPDEVEVVVPATPADARLSLGASAGSDARFDVAGLTGLTGGG